MSKRGEKALVPKKRFPEFQNAEEWEEKPFSKLFEIGSGKDYKHLGKGAIPVYGSGGYMLSVDEYLYDGESACIGRKGTINNPIFLTGKFWTVDTLFYTHSFKDCLPKFVFLLFQNINWLKFNEAGGVPSLSKVIINKIERCVPGIEEQQKIADCLTSIDELIAAHSQKLLALKAYKKGLMQQLFPAEGETEPKLRFPEFRGRGEWDAKPISKVGKVVTGNTPSTSDKSNYGGSKMFVSPADISDHRFVTQTNTTLSEAGFAKTRHIPEQSILFVCIGSTIGKVAQNMNECATNQQINAVIPFEKYVNAFIYYALDLNSSKIAELAGKQAVPIINKTLFSTVALNVPSKKEQQKIADCLASIDDLITAQAQKVDTLKAHKKGLMQQLFPVMDDK